jgi:hypothetical protein
MAKTIVYTRLPTGHTHEDIDACFAHIWKWMKNKPVETIPKYKEGIEKAFKGTRLAASVRDVYVIPNYIDFFEDAIDEHLKNYTKEIETQHQWRFQAVQPSPNFLSGVKVTYRAYSSDKVIEFKQLPKHLCITPIGQLTGLEGSS